MWNYVDNTRTLVPVATWNPGGATWAQRWTLTGNITYSTRDNSLPSQATVRIRSVSVGLLLRIDSTMRHSVIQALKEINNKTEYHQRPRTHAADTRHRGHAHAPTAWLSNSRS